MLCSSQNYKFKVNKKHVMTEPLRQRRRKRNFEELRRFEMSSTFHFKAKEIYRKRCMSLAISD